MKKKQTLSFKFKYLVFVMLLVCLALLAVAYVWTLLNDYENSQPERKVEAQLSEMQSYAENGVLWNKFAFPTLPESDYESSDIRALYTNEFAEGGLTYKLKPGTFSETSLVYNVIGDDGMILAEIILEAVGEPVTKLAVFTIQEWKISAVDIVAEMKDYTIEAPADFTVTLNGITLGDDVMETLDDGSVKYTVKNILTKPDIVITDPSGQIASYKTSGTRIKTEFYDYSLTLPSTLMVYLNGELHKGVDMGDGTVRHEIRSLTNPEVKIADLMGNSLIYSGGSTLPLTYCQVIAEDIYTINVNGEAVPDSMKTVSDNPDYEHLVDYVDGLPKIATYNIAVLVDNATIVAADKDSRAVMIDAKEKVRDLTDIKSGNDVPEEVAAQADVLAIAQKWSLFMSKDLTGANYGFWDLANYLVKDSYLYNVAYKYATGIDITFTSIHTLKNPAFTNETVDNFKWITDDCFSVDIGFDKHMVLGDGRDLTDTMYSTFYFVNNEHTDNTWKLIQIKEIVE